MDDKELVARLRERAGMEAGERPWMCARPSHMILREAADAIELLERERDEALAENDRLREAIADARAKTAVAYALRPECNPHGYKTDASLWLGRAMSILDAVLTPSGIIPAAKNDQAAGAIPSGKTEEADARD